MTGFRRESSCSPLSSPRRCPRRRRRIRSTSSSRRIVPAASYHVGDTVGWTVTPALPSTYAYKSTIRATTPWCSRKARLDLPTGKATIEIVADEPAMIYVAVEAYEDPVASDNGRAGQATRGSSEQHRRRHRLLLPSAQRWHAEEFRCRNSSRRLRCVLNRKLAAQASLSSTRF